MKKIALLFLLTLVGFIGYWIVLREQKVVKSPQGPLHTAFKEAPASLRFFALGDTGSGDANQFAVAQAMEKKCQEGSPLTGILLLGDMAYMEGIQSVDDKQWQEKIEKPYGSNCLANTMIYPILGNHDYRGSTQAMVDYSLKNPRWHMPHRFYTLDFGSLFKITAMDTGFIDFCLNEEKCSMDFLFNSIKTNDKPFHLVMAHHPIKSSSDHGFNHSGESLLSFFLSHFICNKIDVWLSGHAHHLEHRQLNPQSCELFISGGGGGELYPVNKTTPEDPSLFTASQYGFLEITVNPLEMTFSFFDKNGDLLYKSHRNVVKR